jgi:hypothetical protein
MQFPHALVVCGKPADFGYRHYLYSFDGNGVLEIILVPTFE